MTNGFFLFENEFYCTNDYHKLFGIKCAGCGNFIEGESISILDDSFHEECFICVSCRFVLSYFLRIPLSHFILLKNIWG